MSDFGFVGEAYEAPSIYQDAQELINWFLEVDRTKPQGERGAVALYPTPGYTTVATLPTGSIRGMHTLTGGTLCLIVSGNTLYKLDSTYTYTSLGTLYTSTGRVYIEDNGITAYIVDGPNRYSWTIATNKFQVLSTTSAPAQVTGITVTNPGSGGLSQPTMTWNTSVTSNITGSWQVRSIAYGNGIYVAVGTVSGGTNTVYTSTDGIVWTQRTLPISVSIWTTVAWNGTVFCAVGDSGTSTDANACVTSPDGINWTARSLPFAAAWRALTYYTGTGIFVAAGFSFGSSVGRLATSSDGITWTSRTLPTAMTSTIPTLGASNSIIVCIFQGSSGNVHWYSADGITWSTGTFITGGATKVAWNGNVFCALQGATPTSISATSANGINWTQRAMPASLNWSGISSIGVVFCAIAYNSNNTYVSNDGINWTLVSTVGGAALWYAIGNNGTNFVTIDLSATALIANSASLSAFGGTYNLIFVGGSGTGAAGTFTVGAGTNITTTSFTQSTLPSSTTWSAIAFSSTLGTGQGRFCAVASGGTAAATSDDGGSTWTARTLPVSANWIGIAWNGTVFCAIATGGSIAATSSDGITWTQRALPVTGTWTAITSNGTIFCAIGWALANVGSITSSDGITWTSHNIGVGYINSVTWTGSMFCAVGYVPASLVGSNQPNNYVYTSIDGASWTRRTLPATALWNAISAGGGNIVAVVYGSNIAATSSDGITWTQQTLPIGNWTSIAWNGSLFCAISSNLGLAATSPDGVTWTQISEPTTESWVALAANTTSGVLVGVASGTSHAMHGNTTTTISGGGVSSTTITNPGIGYTTAPSVSFANCPGLTGVIATVNTSASDGAFQGGDKVVIIDNFFVYNRPNSNQFAATTALSTTTQPLSFASKLGSPDNIVSIIVTNRELYLLGEKQSEVWVDVGSFPFPFQIIPGSSSQHGCAAKDSVALFADSFAFVSKDQRGQGIIVIAQGYKFLRISTHAVENSLVGKVISDAVAYSYQIEGHEFYVVNFPTADLTWVFDGTTQRWHKWMTVDAQDKFHRHKSECHSVFQGQNLVGDYSSGKIYALSNTTYTENGSTIRRLRRCPHIVSDLQRQTFNELQIQFQPGVGLATGQGTTPQAMLRWSDDGGSTWSNEHWRSIGTLGAYKNRAIWRRLGQARDRIYEVVVTDPVKAVIVSANLKAEMDGN